MTARSKLQAARHELGLSAAKVVQMIQARVAAHGLPDDLTFNSRKTQLSRWENKGQIPEPEMRAILREIYGRTNTDLGFPDDTHPDGASDELTERIQIASEVDDETAELFRQEIDHVRQIDRRRGAPARLDHLRNRLDELADTVAHTLSATRRATLAAALVEGATLAGWDSLDGGSLNQAWRHYEQAKTFALEAGSPALRAHAIAEQAFVLIDAGHLADAVDATAHARHAGRETPPLLQAWLAAAAGEALAVAGERDRALRSFDDAAALLPPETTHPELPFLYLAGSHLDRWRSNALVHLGDHHTITDLERIAERTPQSFARAAASVQVDLALAHAAAGNRDAATTHAHAARKALSRLGSVRLRRRLERLIVP